VLDRRRLVLALLVAAALAPARPVRAHYGPPFPILTDRRVGPYVVSVWADPNIGTGFFYVLLDAAPGARLPARTRVRIAIQPVSKRLPEVLYELAPQPARQGQRFYTSVQFDRGELWRTRVVIASSAGGGELATEVEPTPAGVLGPLGSLIYVFPFAGVGFLWIKAALRRRAAGPPAAAPVSSGR
jgi:hypothetical protein